MNREDDMRSNDEKDKAKNKTIQYVFSGKHIFS